MQRILRLRNLVLILIGIALLMCIPVGVRGVRRYRAEQLCQQGLAYPYTRLRDTSNDPGRNFLPESAVKMLSIFVIPVLGVEVTPALSTASDYRRILQFPEIDRLTLTRSEILQPEQMHVVCQQCPNLTMLDIEVAEIAPGSLQTLQHHRHVRHLSLVGVKHAPWEEFKDLRKFSSISLSHCEVDAAFAGTLSSLSGLKSLSLQHGSFGGNHPVVLPYLPRLSNLRIEDCEPVDLSLLHSCLEIQRLYVEGVADPAQVVSQCASLPRLTVLNVVSRHPSQQLRDEDLQHLGSISSLRRLCLGSLGITDQCESTLGTLTHLKSLDFHGCSVSPACLRRLRVRLPATEIYAQNLAGKPVDWTSEDTVTLPGTSPHSLTMP